MLQRENWIILCINTIIIVVVLFILFRQQDTKLRSHIRRIEKKMSCQKPQININSEQKYQNQNQNVINNDMNYIQQNKNEESGSTRLITPPSDIDSFYDPMQN
jgi:predicted Holliday junction resolvase-like endonuclease